MRRSAILLAAMAAVAGLEALAARAQTGGRDLLAVYHEFLQADAAHRGASASCEKTTMRRSMTALRRLRSESTSPFVRDAESMPAELTNALHADIERLIVQAQRREAFCSASNAGAAEKAGAPPSAAAPEPAGSAGASDYAAGLVFTPDEIESQLARAEDAQRRGDCETVGALMDRSLGAIWHILNNQVYPEASPLLEQTRRAATRWSEIKNAGCPLASESSEDILEEVAAPRDPLLEHADRPLTEADLVEALDGEHPDAIHARARDAGCDAETLARARQSLDYLLIDIDHALAERQGPASRFSPAQFEALAEKARTVQRRIDALEQERRAACGGGEVPPAEADRASETSPREEAGPRLTGGCRGFAGQWMTNYGPMVLRQEGSVFTGEYGAAEKPGTLRGVVEGAFLRGRWEEGPGSSGEFGFELVAAENRFAGGWVRDQGDAGSWSGECIGR